MRSCETPKPRISSYFSESREPDCDGSVVCLECLRKGWGGKFCWPHSRESGPEVVQGPDGVATFPTLLGPVLVWSQQNYLRFLKTVKGIPSVLRAAAPVTFSRGKAGVKMNETNVRGALNKSLIGFTLRRLGLIDLYCP